MISVRDASGLHAIGAARMRDASGLFSIAAGRVRDASGLYTFYSVGGGTLTLTATPPTVNGGAAVVSFATVGTLATTVTVEGGTGELTYSWALDTDDGGTWTVDAPGSATTAFTCALVNEGDSFTASFICTVTDETGASSTVTVSATAFNYGRLYDFL